ncbi:MAG: hypothetical protein GQ474_06325 [Sulfurimonas sp.]|nr:hypothetical protein [Sulfurimonas sp.]
MGTRKAAGKAVLHGISRGAITKAQGGKFSAGFWSGFMSSGFSVGTSGYGGFEGRTAIMAIIGGTTSALSGGKFANGAVTGAFVHMFNAEGKRLVAYAKGKFVGLKEEKYSYTSNADRLTKYVNYINYSGRNELRTELYTGVRYTLKVAGIINPEPYSKFAMLNVSRLMKRNESEWNH